MSATIAEDGAASVHAEPGTDEQTGEQRARAASSWLADAIEHLLDVIDDDSALALRLTDRELLVLTTWMSSSADGDRVFVQPGSGAEAVVEECRDRSRRHDRLQSRLYNAAQILADPAESLA